MTNESKDFLLLTDLPLDILLRVFCYCRLFDILNLSATCKRLQEAVDEHQAWFQQVKLLQIPISPGATPSKAELKEWAISRVKVDIRWIGGLNEDNRDDLVMHRFDFERDPFTHAYYLPGGEFLVFLHASGSISLKRIEESAHTGEWELPEVARYDPQNVGDRPAFSNGTLNEVGCGRFVLAYTVVGDLNRFFVFFIDIASRTIEEGPVVQINPISIKLRYGILVFKSVWVVKNTIFCFREYHSYDDPKYSALVVVRLGAEMIQRHFLLDTPAEMAGGVDYCHFFALSENSVVLCDADGTRLYHVPELGSVRDNTTLSAIWDSEQEPRPRCRGSLCDAGSPNPTLYVQGPYFTEIIDFGLDEHGIFFAVTDQRIEEATYYGDDWVDWLDDRVMLKGRKVLSYEAQPREFLRLQTALLGGGDAKRKLRTRVASFDRGYPIYMGQVDLDERTGRILIAADYPANHEETQPYITRVYLADLPK